MYGHKYTETEKEFMREFVPGHSYLEIQSEFIKKFGWEITKGQIKSYIGNNKLNTGRTGRFEKGNIPQNKGKKMSKEVYNKVQTTMFKKGNIPHNYRPVGSERITKDGYIEIKVKDPNKWKLKHRVLWEEINGDIPNDCIIIFKDGDKKNISIDNLIMIKKSVNAIYNRMGLSYCDKELKETTIKLAELKLSTSKAKKKIKIESMRDKNG